MSRLRRHLTAIACVIAIALPAAAPARAAETLDGIAAVVNEDVVLHSELRAEVDFVRDQMRRNGQRVPPDSVLRERVLERLILENIQIQRAEQRGISVDDEAVNNALRNMADRNGTNLSGLRQRVEADGMDFQRLRNDIRRQLIVSRLRQREVASQVQISEDEVDSALDRMEQANQQEAEYRLSHILIGLPSDATSAEVTEAREEAEALVERLRDDAEFSSIATRASDGPEALNGGDLGWRSATSLPTLFVEAVRGMSTGAISDPLRSPNGFHILKVEDRRGGSEQTVTEIRARHILLKDDGGMDDPDAPADAETEGESPRERLEALRQRIRAGADFAEIARANSEDQGSASRGGDLGWVGPGEMTPAFQQVIEGLEPGTLSEPFRSPYGWHLAEVLEKRQRQDIEEYQRAQARRALYERELEQEAQRWRQRLRDQAYVEIRADG
ncbi:peptidylprolyl isomerase [Halofilum ochraceum]|uniref:peptidylprolyl isomerase n=1 Tax=Halofilum ochraceum TaxID=1611323 RepID=UPI000833A427|nr:peptidylprolyl isomerase [Halofilum ochraceum]